MSQPSCGAERIERIIKHDISEISAQNQNVEGGGNFAGSNGSSSGPTFVYGADGRYEPAVILTTDGMLGWFDENGLLNQVSYQDFCIDMYVDKEEKIA